MNNEQAKKCKVKAFLEKGKEFALTTAVLVSGNHIRFRLVIQYFDHFSYNLRPLLQIRIDQAYIFTTCVLQTGV